MIKKLVLIHYCLIGYHLLKLAIMSVEDQTGQACLHAASVVVNIAILRAYRRWS